MGEALTHPIVAPALTKDVEACVDAEFVACMVCACGSVITGVKPAELFGFSPRGSRFDASPERLQALALEATSVYARGLADTSVRIVSLGMRRGRQMLLCWRPEALRDLLRDKDSADFLQRNGFCTQGEDALVQSAAERLSRYYAGADVVGSRDNSGEDAQHEFPHAVGVLLGFPVRDVEGFIANGGRGELACGQWKVYGDVECAKRRFARLARAKKRCSLLSARGYSVRELIRERKARELT